MGFNLANVLGGGLLGEVKGIIGSLKLDPEVKAKIDAAVDERADAIKLKELEIEDKVQVGVHEEVIAQIAVNETDAKGNLYQSSWRPTIGYICGAGLAYQFLGRPLLNFIAALVHSTARAEQLEIGTLMTLLFGMLGLGALRSVDKKNA